ncbi:hypothetical protein [Methanosphaera cuniculi]|uniref:hypothetical protein n=1 Tax=Methanosphaera cuniculi TaxID=1077256 RepID=UPI0026EC7199|nr:hypothetical protein [Methanosphaera cuniculi]
MKRSRLKLFKTTSLTISLIAILLIILSIGIAAYIGVSDVSNSVTNKVSNGASYDSLNQIKSDYSNLSKQYDTLDKQLGSSPDVNVKSTFNNGVVKLSEANHTIESIDSDISKGESEDIVNEEINKAKDELKQAHDIYNQIAGGNVAKSNTTK